MIVRGRKYPILVMDWIEGATLDVHIEGVLKLADARRHLRRLADQWLHTINELYQLGCAHGDLQHGNVLVDNGAYTLVDFDGFFVPSLTGLPSIENGHIHYQHPQRRAEFFGGTLDRFSSLVIYLSLIALERDPQLWQRYHDENLLFKRPDFEAPGKTPLWGDLKRLDAGCRRLTEVLERACLAPAAASPCLLDLVSLAPRSSVSSASHLGAIAVRSREAVLVRKPPPPKSKVGNAAPAFAGRAPVVVPRRTRRMPHISSSALTALHMFCSGMAIAAALASFVPLFQPWILAVGVIFIAGAWPVLARRRLAGPFTAVAGLMALMAVGTSVCWVAIWPLLNPSQNSSTATGRKPLAAPLSQATQTQSTAVSKKINSHAEEHVAAAQALFQRSEFAKALIECDRALATDPRNEQARSLRDRISKMQDMLEGKAH
jgi:hypothetical protein